VIKWTELAIIAECSVMTANSTFFSIKGALKKPSSANKINLLGDIIREQPDLVPSHHTH